MSQMYNENINFKINRLINLKHVDNFKMVSPIIAEKSILINRIKTIRIVQRILILDL